jgi:GT2 family glycosyltransferase
MLISIIVCTYGRAEALIRLLGCLAGQAAADFEVLIVDGSGENPSVRVAFAAFLREHPSMSASMRLIGSAKGLTRQRNIGIDLARGDLLCFLDDDVTMEPGFLRQLAELFARPDFAGVGGMTAYDLQNYPTPLTLKWRLRRLFRIVPALVPGAIDRLGRGIPVSFLKPFSGVREIGYLPGFCMIYRRPAIGTLRFDEQLPTYGGEDRDFSFRAGQSARLLICGDLRVKHHYAQQSRDSDVQRIYQDGFGSGRMFAKHARRSDRIQLIHFLLFDALVNLVGVVREPSFARLRSAVARTRGIAAGFRSWVDGNKRTEPVASRVTEEMG